jgi:hypothetical protein
MPGGKGKSVGGKATGAKDSSAKSQKSHSAKAGLQVSKIRCCRRRFGCTKRDAPGVEGFVVMRDASRACNHFTCACPKCICSMDPRSATASSRWCAYFWSSFRDVVDDARGLTTAYTAPRIPTTSGAASIAITSMHRLELSGLTLYQFPCGRVKRFLKNNTQNKMRVGAKGKQHRVAF